MEWSDVFKAIKSRIDFNALNEFLENKYADGEVYPDRDDIYRAFELLPFNEVKVVILGQDPYHGPGQANGLAFSVNEGVKTPPSLVNIYKELEADLNIKRTSGNLDDWAKKGVLLLNTTLTVDKGQAGSHRKIGWVPFTDAVIEAISEHHEHVVFILWGKPAQSKSHLIDTSKHLIIQNVHPSPLSAYRGFFGSRPFSEVNEYLRKHNESPIDWSEET